jgi:hypothetical protein
MASWADRTARAVRLAARMRAIPGGCAKPGADFFAAAVSRILRRRADIEIYTFFSFPHQANTREWGKQLCVGTDVVQKWYRTSTCWTKTGRDLYEICTCWDGGGEADAIGVWSCGGRAPIGRLAFPGAGNFGLRCARWDTSSPRSENLVASWKSPILLVAIGSVGLWTGRICHAV